MIVRYVSDSGTMQLNSGTLMRMPPHFFQRKERFVARIRLYKVATLCLFLVISFYSHSSERDSSVPPSIDSIQTNRDSDRLMRMWARSCALCHVDGNGGAPVAGNQGDWAPRLAQGTEILVARTIEGYNKMPPLGYCMACSKNDLLELIDFMVKGVALESQQK